jgi:glycosyltransferase involved in cell wall biosynthesis
VGNDDVTVVIACYNYGEYIGEAVASVLAQQGGPPRVVVVDDGSDDLATQVALSTLPPAVDLVRQSNGGVCRARNAGLKRVATPLVLVLDADDRLRSGALVALRAPLTADPHLGYAYGAMRFFGEMSGVLRLPPYDPYRLLYRHTIGLSALVRREVLEQTGGFDPAMEAYEDWELWVNALSKGWHGRQVDAVVLDYRRHGATKLLTDRHLYRNAYRAIRRKHTVLYARRDRVAAMSSLGPFQRAAYRFYWGPRPLPAGIEHRIYSLLWRGQRAGAFTSER